MTHLDTSSHKGPLTLASRNATSISFRILNSAKVSCRGHRLPPKLRSPSSILPLSSSPEFDPTPPPPPLATTAPSCVTPPTASTETPPSPPPLPPPAPSTAESPSIVSFGSLSLFSKTAPQQLQQLTRDEEKN